MKSSLRSNLRRASLLALLLPMPGLCGCAFARLDGALIERTPHTSGPVPGATITRLTKDGTERVTPTLGMELKKGDVVETDGTAHLDLWFPGSRTHAFVYPNTRIHLSSIFVDIGTVFISVFVESPEKLKVEQARVEAHIRRTAYKMVVPLANELILTVLNGTVAVVKKSGKGTELVEAFERLKMDGSDIGHVERLTDAEKEDLIREYNDLATLSGSEMQVVPDCLGRSREEARQRLADAGLGASFTEQATENHVDVNRVLGQSPVAGAFQKAKQNVRLTVGVQGVRVPRLQGFGLRDAQDAAGRQGLRVQERETELVAGTPAGTILRQDPPADTLVPVGSTVNVVTAAEAVTVPNLIGQHVKQADMDLTRSQLRLQGTREEITGRFRVGTVISHSPQAGSLVPPGSGVSLVIEGDSVRVPDLTGKSIGAAQREVGRSLRIVERGTQVTRKYKPGIIIFQHTPANTAVAPGTEIGVTVEGRPADGEFEDSSPAGPPGKGGIPVPPDLGKDSGILRLPHDQPKRMGKPVPQLIKLTASQAQAQAAKAGFNVQRMNRGDLNDAYRVVKQMPESNPNQLYDPARTTIQIWIEPIGPH